jgi:nucleotide sugar dehydrogenase
MTSQFVGTAVEDRVRRRAEALSQPLLEAPAGELRVTRGAGSGEALVAVVGLGSSGLPSALALRRAGFRVLAIDTSASRLSEIRSGRAEQLGVSRRELQAHLDDTGFVLSDELAATGAADMVLICVATDVDAHGRPNSEALERTCAAAVRNARAGQTFVLTSATYVGATRELLVQPLGERGLSVGEDVFVAFSPERVDPGATDHEPLGATRVLGGVTEACFRHASLLLHPICQELHRVSSPAAGEMVRLYESTFRAVNIALAFEMADACRVDALDPIEVTEAAASKPFGFMAHYPSAGVGGRAVGIDPHHLTAPLRERGLPMTLAESATRILAARPERVATRAHELLLRSGRQLRELRVLVVGAAYKPGVADTTNAPAVEIVSRLLAEGVQVDFHDPLVNVLQVDGEDVYAVDPDPRRDASGFGPEDYELAIVVGLQPGHDYGWLSRCPQVLDCTYRQRTGRRHFLL